MHAKAPELSRPKPHSPRVEIVVALVDGLGELLDARRVVLLVDRDQLLRQRVEELDLVLVLVQLRVERLRTNTMSGRGESRCYNGHACTIRARGVIEQHARPGFVALGQSIIISELRGFGSYIRGVGARLIRDWLDFFPGCCFDLAWGV